MRFYDTVRFNQARITKDGYLVGNAPVARTGIQIYSGAELGINDKDIVRVFRPEEEVFDKDSLSTYANRPMTNTHPDEMVNSINWKDNSVGITGSEVVRDGEFVRVDLSIMDQGAIDDYNNGKRELSMGYDAQIEFVDGTYNGEPYDAVMRNLRMNHLALVYKARGGESLKIGDRIMPDGNNLRTVMVDGLSVKTTDEGAQAISKLQSDLEATKKDIKELKDSITESNKKHETEMAVKDAKIEELEKQILSDSDIDKIVENKAKLISDAMKIYKANYANMKDMEIINTALKGAFGDSIISNRSDEYKKTRFEIAVEDVSKNTSNKNTSNNGYALFVDQSNNNQGNQNTNPYQSYMDSISKQHQKFNSTEAK